MENQNKVMPGQLEPVVKLLPCPFCGNPKPRFIKDGAKWMKGVECLKCRHNIYFFGKNHMNIGMKYEGRKAQNAVAEYWNKRAKIEDIL